MSEHQSPEDSGPETDEERRERLERRSLIDLTRAERGEPERRLLPGIERRTADEDDPGIPDR
ncbi:MAG: hypothetical protein ACRYF3_14730 [Janthinobacterium lividum]